MQTPLKLNLLFCLRSQIRIEDGAVSVLQLRMLRLKLRGFNHLVQHHQRLRQIQLNTNPTNLQIVRSPIFAPATLMADAPVVEKNPVAPEKKSPEKKKKEPPTPPEKPEAGDCCGSGCVRCVWDVYYEELESYEQALKDFNNSPPN